MAIPKETVEWDAKRNTSMVHAVAPDAVKEALRACRQLARDQPALVEWLKDGHPTLTEAEHYERFGEPYHR